LLNIRECCEINLSLSFRCPYPSRNPGHPGPSGPLESTTRGVVPVYVNCRQDYTLLVVYGCISRHLFGYASPSRLLDDIRTGFALLRAEGDGRCRERFFMFDHEICRAWSNGASGWLDDDRTSDRTCCRHQPPRLLALPEAKDESCYVCGRRGCRRGSVRDAMPGWCGSGTEERGCGEPSLRGVGGSPVARDVA